MLNRTTLDSEKISRKTLSLHRLETLINTPLGLLSTCLILICAFPLINSIDDPDFWWHLRTGQLILEHHKLIGADPYTYTVSSHHWVMHEWGSEILFAVLNKIGGFGLISITFSVITGLGILFIARKASYRNPASLLMGIGLLLAVVAGGPLWGPRTQMITFTFTCLALWLVERQLKHGGRSIWGLVPLTILWANLHSGFIIGLGFVTLVFIAELLSPNANLSRVKTIGKVLLACLAAGIINANGPNIYLYPIATQFSSAQQRSIVEWFSPNFHLLEVKPFEFILLSLIVMVVINRKIPLSDATIALASIVMALQSERHIAIFIAVTTPIWIGQVDIFIKDRLADFPRFSYSPHKSPKALRISTAALVIILIIGMLSFKAFNTFSVGENDLSYAQTYPVCATRWLLQSSPGLRIFNQYGEGGYLVNKLYDHQDKVFIFGDAALMGDEQLNRYTNVEQVQPSWETTVLGAKTDVILFDTDAPLSNVVSQDPNWTMVYKDPRSVAFVRKDHLSALGLSKQTIFSSNPNDVCNQLNRVGIGSTS